VTVHSTKTKTVIKKYSKEDRTQHYSKVIIVDFDDTLCLHAGYDKSNIAKGEPNLPLILKLNELFDRGYSIQIYTARGHISSRTRKEADTKYRSVIQEWLQKYGVKYSHLTFNKPLGIIYIDDKSVRPDEIDLIDSITR
jgi:hypothetical protein